MVLLDGFWYLLPSGWNDTQLMGPKCPFTLPNSSSYAAWKNLRTASVYNKNVT